MSGFGSPLAFILLGIVGVAAPVASLVVGWLKSDRSDTPDGERLPDKFHAGSSQAAVARDDLWLDDSDVSDRQFQEAIAALEKYIIDESAEWLVGINTSGRLLSVYLGRKAKLPDHRLRFIAPDSQGGIANSNSSLNGIYGNIFLVDDVSRTGRTFRLAAGEVMKRFIADDTPAAVRVVSMASVVPGGHPNMFVPHFFAFRSRAMDLSLPWSFLSRKIRDNLQNRKEKKEYDSFYTEMYEKIVGDQAFAFEVAELFVREGRGVSEAYLRRRYAGRFSS